MARFYSNENFPLQAVLILRRVGHDVLTSLEAGKANRSVPDDEVLRFAAKEQRCLLTQNRLHFLRLHRRLVEHSGIVVRTFDPDFERLARHIHEQVQTEGDLAGKLIRINRPSI